jgi:hypothetical protein
VSIIEKPKQFMERRAFERMSANIHVKFYWDNTVYFGTVTNFSVNGMFINTIKIIFPLCSQFEIFIPSINNKVLKLPVKVSRLAERNCIYYGMGVELLNIPEDSLEFINDMR